MSRHPICLFCKLWISSLAPLSLLNEPAAAQIFTTRVGDANPLKIGAFIPSDPVLDMDLGIKGRFKGQFLYGIGGDVAYDSNFFLTEDHEEDEIILSLTPWITYISDPEGGAPVSFSVNYAPTVVAFLENSDLNSTDQTADFTLKFTGSRTDVSLFGSYAEISGTDELSEEFLNGKLYTTGIRANRQIASRTTMNAGCSYATSDYTSGDAEGAEMLTAYVGGLWQKSERLGLGTTLRYTMSESDNISSTAAWALLLELRYKAGERVWLSASLGPQYIESVDSGSSISLTGDLSARYVINERWTWMNSLQAVTVPSPNETDFVVTTTSFSTGLQRQLLRGSVGGGLDLRLSQYDAVGDTLTPPDDGQNVRLFLNYGRSIFSEKVDLNTRISYAVNDGERNWSQVEASIGISMAF